MAITLGLQDQDKTWLFARMEKSALKRARAALGLTQEQLARKAGVNVGLIRAWEGGVTRAPRLDLALAVARALDIDVAALASPVGPRE